MKSVPTWLVVELPGGELAAELLGETLMELGAKGMAPEGERLIAAFPGDTSAGKLLPELRRRMLVFATDRLLPDGPIKARLVEDEDWVGRWRRSLGPIRAGEHFLIVPPGVGVQQSPEDIVLVIEPRMAFGTGEHATTRLALSGLERLPVQGARVLDLGCGNGILSVAALLLGAEEVAAVDFEAESVIETRENAERHGAGGRITVERADVLDWAPAKPMFDILLANLYITPIQAGLPRWRSWLKAKGHGIFTGVKEGDEERELLSALAGAKLRVLCGETLDTWFCAVCETETA